MRVSVIIAVALLVLIGPTATESQATSRRRLLQDGSIQTGMSSKGIGPPTSQGTASSAPQPSTTVNMPAEAAFGWRGGKPPPYKAPVQQAKPPPPGRKASPPPPPAPPPPNPSRRSWPSPRNSRPLPPSPAPAKKSSPPPSPPPSPQPKSRPPLPPPPRSLRPPPPFSRLHPSAQLPTISSLRPGSYTPSTAQAPLQPPDMPEPPAEPDWSHHGPLLGGNCPDVDAVFNLTNFYRRRHQARPLTWDPKLAASATAYAQVLAQEECVLKHSGGKNYGENLMQVVSAPRGPGAECASAIQGWYDEVIFYRWDVQQPFHDNWKNEVGHFTQLVWRGTSTFGCGVGLGAATMSFGNQKLAGGCKMVVCQYQAPGNFEGDMFFLKNVLPPIS